MIFNISLLEPQKIIVLVFILQTFIFVVNTILASGTYREFEKQKAKKEVEKLLAQGKISEAKKLARKYGVFRK